MTRLGGRLSCVRVIPLRSSVPGRTTIVIGQISHFNGVIGGDADTITIRAYRRACSAQPSTWRCGLPREFVQLSWCALKRSLLGRGSQRGSATLYTAKRQAPAAHRKPQAASGGLRLSSSLLAPSGARSVPYREHDTALRTPSVRPPYGV